MRNFKSNEKLNPALLVCSTVYVDWCHIMFDIHNMIFMIKLIVTVTVTVTAVAISDIVMIKGYD